MSPWLWLLVPFAPLVMLLLLLRWPDRTVRWLWLCLLPAGLAVLTLPTPLALEWLWPDSEWHTGDLVGRSFLGFTALLWGLASLYGVRQLEDHPQRRRFWCFWLLTLSGNLLLLIAQDGASFYVGFTLMSLSAYPLIVHMGGPGPRQAGRLYLQMAVVGELLLYAALMLRITEAGGALDFATWKTTPIGPAVALLLFVGLGIKAGFWPFHFWLPLAHPAAPAAASAVLSGAMIKAGVLGLWRFMPQADPMLAEWAPIVIGIGLFSAFFGVLKGLLQIRLKAVLAYSSVSQIGYLLMIVALSWLAPSKSGLWMSLLALYGVHHGLAKGALFMAAGLGQHYRLPPVLLGLFAVPALTLAGLPLTSGGGLKPLLKEGFYATGLDHWNWMLSIGSTATALVLFRAWYVLRAQQRNLPASTPLWTHAGGRTVVPLLLACTLPLLAPLSWPPLRDALVTSLTRYNLVQGLWPIVVAALLAYGALLLPSTWLGVYSRWSQHSSRHSGGRLMSLRLKRIYTSFMSRRLSSPSADYKTATWGMVLRRWERVWNRLWRGDKIAFTVLWLCLLLMGMVLGLTWV